MTPSVTISHWHGTLYNREYITAECGSPQGETVDDAALLLLAFAKWGNDLISHLDGDFSFAISLGDQAFFCARDPLGVKALYYTRIDDTFHFSADIGFLLSLPGCPKEVNRQSLHSMLFSRKLAYSDTMYQGIHRLPPGHTLQIKGNSTAVDRYWYPERIAIDYTISEAEAARRVKTLLERALKKRIQDLSTTAFEVSGGLDSSSLVALTAQKAGPQKVHSYSMSFGDMSCDEGEYMESLLHSFSLKHKNIPTQDLDYHNRYSLENLYALSPHWPITMTFAMALPMLEAMKRDGKKVVISGQGGDHLFVGSPYVLHSFFKRRQYRQFFKELSSFKSGPWKAAKSYLIRPLLCPTAVTFLKKILRKKSTSPFLQECSAITDISEEMGITDPCQKESIDSINSAFFVSIMDGGFCHCAEQGFGVEYRHPYFDQELVEYVLSLPPEYMYSRGIIKRVLRRAMESVLPEKIRSRDDKAEFSPVLAQQLATIPLKPLLKESHLARLGIISQDIIDQQLEAFNTGQHPHIALLWLIINVEFWYRTHFEI